MDFKETLPDNFSLPLITSSHFLHVAVALLMDLSSLMYENILHNISVGNSFILIFSYSQDNI